MKKIVNLFSICLIGSNLCISPVFAEQKSVIDVMDSSEIKVETDFPKEAQELASEPSALIKDEPDVNDSIDYNMEVIEKDQINAPLFTPKAEKLEPARVSENIEIERPQLLSVTSGDFGTFGTSTWTKTNNVLTISAGILGTENAPWDSNTTKIIITGKVVANDNTKFKNCTSLKEIEGLEHIDFSQTTNLNRLFEKCSQLTSLDLSSWNISGIENLSCLFQDCRGLKEIKGLETWDTSSVVDMNWMFYGVHLDDLNLSNMDLSSMQTVNQLFRGAEIQKLDVTNWQTSNVTDFSRVFSICKVDSLIGLETWDTSSGVTFSQMFLKFNENSTFDASAIENWDLSSAKDLSYMFWDSSIEKLDVSKWNAINLEDITSTFASCPKLTSVVGLEFWDVSKANKVRSTFGKSKNLLEVKGLKNWEFNGDVIGMFLECESLATLDISNWKFLKKGMKIGNNFDGCHGLESIDLSNWDLSNLADFRGLFNGLRSLKYVNASDWKFGENQSLYAMFAQGYYIEQIDMSNWDTSTVTDFSCLFVDCRSLKNIDVANWNTSQAKLMKKVFSRCYSLETLNLSKWDTSSVTDMEGLLVSCPNLKVLSLGSKTKLAANIYLPNVVSDDTYSGKWRSTTTDWSGDTSDLINKSQVGTEDTYVWETNSYTVRFDSNSGEGIMAEQLIQRNMSQTLTKNNFSKAGYLFNGWNTKPNGTGISYADEEQVTNLITDANQEVSLYAQWCLLGDVNNDGVVTGLDIIALKEYLVSGELPLGVTEKHVLSAGDLNRDGVVTVADIVALQEYLVSGELPR